MDPEELRKLSKKVLITTTFFVAAYVFYFMRWRTVLVVYILAVAVISVLAILIQSGRGGGLAASLGGLGGDSLLGTRSATPIAKATYVLLGLFVFLAILIARMGMPSALDLELLPGEPAKEPLLEMPEAGEEGQPPAGETGEPSEERPTETPDAGPTETPSAGPVETPGEPEQND